MPISDVGTTTAGISVARAVAQKEENHEHDQHDGNKQRPFHFKHGSADGRRAVEHHRHVDSRRDGRLERRQRGLDTVHRGNDVRTGLPKKDQGNARLAVHESGGADVLDRILHVCDVGQFDGRAIPIRDDERLVIRRFEQLVVRPNVGGRVSVGELALRQIRVLLAQHRAHIFEAQTETVQLRGIDVHAHGGQRAAADGDIADALNLQQALLNDRGRGIVKLASAVNVRRERENHDRRVGGIDFAVGRVARQVGRQVSARGVDGRLHVARRAVNVPVQIKLQRDAGRAEIAGRSHFGDARDVAELPFQRRGDGRRHDFGTRTRQRRRHTDGREIHLRQRRDRQLQVSDDSRHDDGRREQRRADGTPDEWCGNVHGVSTAGMTAAFSSAACERENFAASRSKKR